MPTNIREAAMTDATALVETSTDVTSISELIATYNLLGDAADGPGLAMLYVPDGVFDVKGLRTFNGREAIIGMVSAATRLRHLTFNPVTQVIGNHAKHSAGLLLLRRASDGRSVSIVTTGRYTDELVRTPEGWRFVSRQVETDIGADTLIALTTGDS